MVKFTKVYAEVDANTFRATPQEMFEAFLDRCHLTAESSPFVVGGDTPPDLGSGPWFRNGTQLYVEVEGSYVPVATTESIVPQVFLGDLEPDPAVYQLWLKTAPNKVIGLYYYAGAELGWLSRGQEVRPLSITTAKLALNSVTTAKLGDASVRDENMASNIPISKWERGTANQFLRMNLDATIPEWDSTHIVSPSIAVTLNSLREYTHNLAETPHMVYPALVCITAEAGWSVGEEVPHPYFYTNGISVASFKNSTKVFIRMGADLAVVDKGTNVYTTVTPANWGLKFYITAA